MRREQCGENDCQDTVFHRANWPMVAQAVRRALIERISVLCGIPFPIQAFQSPTPPTLTSKCRRGGCRPCRDRELRGRWATGFVWATGARQCCCCHHVVFSTGMCASWNRGIGPRLRGPRQSLLKSLSLPREERSGRARIGRVVSCGKAIVELTYSRIRLHWHFATLLWSTASFVSLACEARASRTERSEQNGLKRTPGRGQGSVGALSVRPPNTSAGDFALRH